MDEAITILPVNCVFRELPQMGTGKGLEHIHSAMVSLKDLSASPKTGPVKSRMFGLI